MDLKNIDTLDNKLDIFKEGVKISKLLNNNTKETLDYYNKLTISQNNIDLILKLKNEIQQKTKN